MPKYTKPRKTWQYSNEFKVNAALLSLIEGAQVKEVIKLAIRLETYSVLALQHSSTPALQH
jgi:transposase-like protein